MQNQVVNIRAKARIKDIARQANVSVGTVDRVLHNRGEVSAETKELVNRVIKELGYEPNIMASALAMKKSFRIAVLMPSDSGGDSIWNLYVEGIKKAKEELNNYGIEVAVFSYELAEEESLLMQYEKLITSAPNAALIIPGKGYSDSYITAGLGERNIPFSIIGMSAEDSDKENTFRKNAYQSGYLAAKLMSYGVSKETTVLTVSIGKNNFCNNQSSERIKGFKAYFNENNITETKIRSIEIASSDDSEVKKALTTAFLDYSFVRGLFVSGCEVHKVAKFISEKKLGNIRLIGYDLLESNIEHLKKGSIDFLISQSPDLQSYKGLMGLYNNLVLKYPPAETKQVPISIFTRENVDFCR